MKLQVTNRMTFQVRGPKRHGLGLSGGRSFKLLVGFFISISITSMYSVASHRFLEED
jgi:hypothetical protein